MNLLFLRGEASRPGEIAYERLEDDTDMWTHLAAALATEPTDQVEVLYWGGRRCADYGWNCRVVWTPDLADWSPAHPMRGRDCPTDFVPDVLFARGGFEDEYMPVLGRLPRSCLRVYYGAGKRFCPSSAYWDLVLCDSEEQIERVRHKWSHSVARLWRKPSSPQFRIMPEVQKAYDVCFVALVPADKRKRVDWVWETCPNHLRVLQLGLRPEGRPPRNFTVDHVKREQMPEAINSCRVTIAPYSSDDGAPRIIAESLACGVPVVASTNVSINPWYCVTRTARFSLWLEVQKKLEHPIVATQYRAYYDRDLSLKVCAAHLAGLFAEAKVLCRKAK